MKPESRRYARLAGVLPVVLVAAIAAAPAAAPAAAEPAVDQPACVESSPEAAAARAAAVECGQPVEVLGARTEYSKTFANPDGTATLEQSVVPQRVRRGNGWVPVDTSLRATPAGVAPVASVLPMTFSAGGGGPLARLTSGDRELELTWDGVLPAPKLSGSTALYRNVLPGVDLRITAEPTGFSEVLVVRSRAAAANPRLSDLQFGLATTGVTVSADEGGGLVATDPEGRRVFTSPAPMMWDSGEEMVDLPAKGAGAGRATASDGARTTSENPVRRAVMPVRVDGDALRLTPDRSILDDPATTFPVYIDPTWTGGISNNAWTTVWSKYPNSSFWRNSTALNNGSTKGAVGAGRTRDCDTCSHHIIRTMFRMDLSGVAGKHVVSADFRVEQRWAWTCSPASDAALWRAPAFSSGTTWNNQGTWTTTNRAQTPGNRKLGAVHGCQGPGVITFNATSMVAGAVDAGATSVSVGLRALNEGTLYQWKRFFHNTATLVVTYENPAPAAPADLESDGQACLTGSARPYVATLTPTLSARQSHPGGGQQSLTTWFHWWPVGNARNDTDRVSASGANPSTVSATVPAGSLTDGGSYAWQAYTTDGQHSGEWSAPCEFSVDGSPPAAPAGVASVSYPDDGQGHGGIGVPGAFAIAPPALRPHEVVAYAYTLDAGVAAEQAPTVPAGPDFGATVMLAPVQDGINELRVWSKDRAGRFSETGVSYTFRVLAGPEKWLDASYGVAGVGGAGNLDPRAGTVDSAGRALVATLTLRRLTATGALDPTFAQVTFPSLFFAHSVVTNQDGAVSVLGSRPVDTDGDGDTDEFAVQVLRFTDTGSWDTTFGDGGTVTLAQQPGGGIGGLAMTTRSDSLLVSWWTHGDGVFIAALTNAGQLDPTWAPGAESPGILELADAGPLTGMIVDGSAVVALFGNQIRRFSEAGVPDETFAEAGVMSTPQGIRLDDLAAAGDGYLVTGASAVSPLVMRVSDGGQLDMSFGINGVAQIPVPCGAARSVSLAAGFAYLVGLNCAFELAVVHRMSLDGVLDTTYGDGGELTIDQAGGLPVKTGALLGQQPDGRLLLAVGLRDGELTLSGVIRLHNEPYGGTP